MRFLKLFQKYNTGFSWDSSYFFENKAPSALGISKTTSKIKHRVPLRFLNFLQKSLRFFKLLQTYNTGYLRYCLSFFKNEAPCTLEILKSSYTRCPLSSEIFFKNKTSGAHEIPKFSSQSKRGVPVRFLKLLQK